MQLGIYQHYKGNKYQVLGMCRHSESLEEMVVYQSLYGDFGLWVRPKEMFLGQVEVSGVDQDRFKFISAGVAEAANLR